MNENIFCVFVSIVIDGQPRYEDIESTSLQEFFEKEYGPNRLQTLILRIANQLYDKLSPEWKKGVLKHHALRMIFQLVEQFIHSEKFQIKPVYEKERKALVVMMKMNEIVNKVFSLIQKDSVEEWSAIFNKDLKFFSTKDSGEWWTKKKTAIFRKTPVNQCVADSSWEYAHARELDRNREVSAWVKNDHLGFTVDYIDGKGKMRKYTPDFVARLSSGDFMILEVKGIKKSRDIQKWDFMRNWTKAVSQSFKKNWHFKISQDATGGMVHKFIEGILKQ